MLRIALVGCGKIADQHVLAINRIPHCQIVSLCDRELLMARQLGERFGISEFFAGLEEMLHASSPDIVHITTPPQSHFAIAYQCLEAGAHVYVEKPFTVTAAEAEELIALANSKKLYLTAGHNYQFTTDMLEMRRVISSGFLGGKPTLVENHFSYDLGDTAYVGAVLGDQHHWVRQLPGRLLHNILSHGIANLAEFLDDEIIDITSLASQSERLRNLGAGDILDELRVLIRDKNGLTGYFCFTTQIKPPLSELRIFGPLNSLWVDHLSGSVIKCRSRVNKSYLTYVLPPIGYAMEYLKNACLNISGFLARRLYQDFGMKELIERFYICIRENGDPPLPYREIILTAKIMDEIFRQIYPSRAEAIQEGRSALAV
jgi:predicted dehydrogenase